MTLAISLAIHTGFDLSIPESMERPSRPDIQLVPVIYFQVDHPKKTDRTHEPEKMAPRNNVLLPQPIIKKKGKTTFNLIPADRAIRIQPRIEPANVTASQTVIRKDPSLEKAADVKDDKGLVQDGRPSGNNAVNVSRTDASVSAEKSAPTGNMVRITHGDDINIKIQKRLQSSVNGCYPFRALRLNLQGTVRIGFCIDHNGKEHNVEIQKSSGYSVLDQAAVDCVLKNATPFPCAPQCVSVPIRFRLKR
jgi:protein TonB